MDYFCICRLILGENGKGLFASLETSLHYGKKLTRGRQRKFHAHVSNFLNAPLGVQEKESLPSRVPSHSGEEKKKIG